MMSVYSEDQTCMKRILMDAMPKMAFVAHTHRLMRHSCDQALKVKASGSSSDWKILWTWFDWLFTISGSDFLLWTYIWLSACSQGELTFWCVNHAWTLTGHSRITCLLSRTICIRFAINPFRILSEYHVIYGSVYIWDRWGQRCEKWNSFSGAKFSAHDFLEHTNHLCERSTVLRLDIPPMVIQPERLIFVALCNDLWFEHQCNTMRAF